MRVSLAQVVAIEAHVSNVAILDVFVSVVLGFETLVSAILAVVLLKWCQTLVHVGVSDFKVLLHLRFLLL